MISKQEILTFATESGLVPTTIEKDYVLSWLLWAISKNEALSKWIFKGGTCLKKCYFETYRFSEDLDFTVPPGAIYTTEEIKSALSEIAKVIFDETGIEIREDKIVVKENINKSGSKTFEAKLGYVGPLNNASNAMARIKFDITNDEIIAEPPELRPVFHFYRDIPEPPAQILCYTLHEILAEKTRAMYEREGRARDVFDVINIGRNFRDQVVIGRALECLRKKFEFKKLVAPTVDGIIARVEIEILRSNWDNQLRHQVSVLPPVESFHESIRIELSWWMEPELDNISLSRFPNTAGEILPRPSFPNEPEYMRRLGIGRQNVGFATRGAGFGFIEQIRYAARNRLQIEFNYKNITRIAEPYSLRVPGTGNLLLYVFETGRDGMDGDGIKSFKLREISDLTITRFPFVARYEVEL